MAALRKLANRVSEIKPFHVMALLAKARNMEASGRDVIHLEVGEPDFPTPENVVEAGIKALRDGKTGYTPATGLPELRQAIADFYQQRFGVELNPRRVIITPGASGAIGLVTGLLFDVGDGVLMSDPGYPCNAHFLQLIGAVAQNVATQAADGFQLNAELVQAHWRPHTRGVWLASPSNPTGTVLELDAMAHIKRIVDRYEGALMVDEIYHCLAYGGQPQTALELPDSADSLFLVNSFSKYFNMTGWRLGWIVAPDGCVDALDRMAQNFYLAAPTMAQYAALEALSEPSLEIYEQRRAILAQRRAYLLGALPQLQFHVPCEPQGAFYIYCDVSAVTSDSFGFCERLLEATGVALTPGIDFGHHNASHFLRIAYTAEIHRLQEAVERIKRFIEREL